MNKIYNVDTEGEITPLMVRDAISQCFFEAHCEDTGLGELAEAEEKDRNKLYCQQIIKKTFDDCEANFEDPSKEDILKVMEELKEFSKNFRDPEVIQRHFTEILGLVNKLK